MPIEIINFDVSGYEMVTAALMALVNTFPGLEEGETFEFATDPAEEGVAIFPTTGSFIYDFHQRTVISFFISIDLYWEISC